MKGDLLHDAIVHRGADPACRGSIIQAGLPEIPPDTGLYHIDKEQTI